MSAEAILIDRWWDAVTLATKEATNGRLALLQGDEWRAYDERGVHIFSMAIGEMGAIASLAPDIFEGPLATPHPVDLRRACEEAAAEFHAEQLYKRFRTRWLLERRDPPEVQA
jgi:hypothetical protein